MRNLFLILFLAGIFETKWEGFRAIVYLKDNLFTVQNRNGNEFKGNFPEVEEITQLIKNVFADGEIVTVKDDKVDFHSFQVTL